MHRRLLSVALVVAVAACGGSSEEAEDGTTSSSASTSSTETATTPTFTGDGSPFCNAMLGLGQLGGAEGATPEQVLTDNAELMTFLDEAQATTPADAPTDFLALLDDYRTAAQAIADAGGDVTAAFAALEGSDPDVVERLGSSASHPEGYAFLEQRCGS